MPPRLILCRHGETPWTLTGAHTSITDLPLTARGALTIDATARTAVGPNRVIDPARLSHIFVSPRLRAQQTLAHLLPETPARAVVQTEDRVREWGYGDYEGLTPAQIRALRKGRGYDCERAWDIWRDGTEGAGGESPEALTGRIDEVIAMIKGLQGRFLKGGELHGCNEPQDVLIVSHGHFLRAFAKRWLGFPLEMNLVMTLDPGGIGVLGYAHERVEEPALVLGGVWELVEAAEK
ncbi:histidine phosphatase superfamily [Sphaerosporella brunnea]|uniref:Histidine phosphatase superfamily n=1 Tax=Sphaerosporella brunnea TaxID=1250544 RepID=A0A5J5EGJ1_9PEZI|nr:histidine phosphatase superfamily [Sphaerosporella brunnea]